MEFSYSNSLMAAGVLWHTSALAPIQWNRHITAMSLRTWRWWKLFLVGVHFKAVTDYSAVRENLLKRDLVPRVARWCVMLQ